MNDNEYRDYEERIQHMHARSGGNEPLSRYEIRDLEREHRIYEQGRTLHLDDDVTIY